jgi:hypothetical protein
MLDLKKYYQYSSTDTEFNEEIIKNVYEIAELIEGCCSDNYLVHTEKGVIVAFENYLNEWSSDLRIYFQPYPANELYKAWDNFVRSKSDV